MPKRLLSLSSVALAAAALVATLGPGRAWGVSFGPVRSMVIMGQPMDASVDLKLQPGEVVTEGCVSAQVNSGDVAVPPSQVSVQILQGSGGDSRVRIRTRVAIDEPFVTLTVSVGCDVRFARQFTVFADPPVLNVALQPQSPAPSAAAAPEVASVPAPALPIPAAPAPRADGMMAGGAAPLPPRAAGRSASGTVQRAPRLQASRTVVTANRARAAAVTTAEPVPAAQADAGSSGSEQRISTGVVSRGEGVARLRLDSPIVASSTRDSPLLRATQQREEAMATAKIAVDVAEVANSSAAQKISEMELQLAAARKEVAEVRAALTKMQADRAKIGVRAERMVSGMSRV